MNFQEISHQRLQPVVAYVWDADNGNFRPATASDFAGSGGGGGGGVTSGNLIATSGVLQSQINIISGNVPPMVIQTVADADATVSGATTLLRYTTPFTTNRTLTLPFASGVASGKSFTLIDQGGIGGGTAQNKGLLLAKQGSDTMNGQGSFQVMNGGFQNMTFTSNGSNNWSISAGALFQAGPSAYGILEYDNSGGPVFHGWGPGLHWKIGGNFEITTLTQAGIVFRTQNVTRMAVDDSNPNLKLGSSADAGIGRNAAGVVEVNNGTFGTLATIAVKDAIGLPFVKTVTGVNLKVAAATSFFTVPAGRRYICTSYIIAPTAVDTVTAPGAFAPFANGGNQLAADTSTAAVQNNSFTLVDSIVQQVNFSDPLTGGQWGVAVAGDNINWNVIIGATATTLTADVSIIGYYI